MFEIDDYCTADAYWAEEEEMKLGNHPSQIKARIEKYLFNLGIVYEEITFLNWKQNSKVEVSLDNNVYGTFDYVTNKFE